VGQLDSKLYSPTVGRCSPPLPASTSLSSGDFTPLSVPFLFAPRPLRRVVTPRVVKLVTGCHHSVFLTATYVNIR
jgi:hypothetical protein